MMARTMMILRRAAGPLLLFGGAALLVAIPFNLASGVLGVTELPWVSLGITFLLAAAFVRFRLPRHRTAHWFAVVGGAFGLTQALDGALLTIYGAGAPRLLSLAALAYHLTTIVASIGTAHVLGLFPDGHATAPAERRTMRLLWLLVPFPLMAFVSSPTIPLPPYHDPPAVANPFQLGGLSGLAPIGELGISLVPIAFVVGVVLLVLRYRRGSPDVRRRIRWLLVPAMLAGFGALMDVLFVAAPDTAGRVMIDGIWIASLVALPITIAIALLRPELLDVDRVLRRSLVYGSLWVLIALAYVAAAATLGMAAGQRLDVGVAIILTVVATLAFQPARQRLERLADRWVFGERIDPAEIVTRLGAALAETFDLDTLLPHIEETLEEGLGVSWAQVQLTHDSSAPGDTSTGLLEGNRR
jgi:hypothetical protein